MIVVGIDPSLTSTGLAAVDTEADGEQLRWSVTRVPTSPIDGETQVRSNTARMSVIADTVTDFVLEQQADVVLIEGLSMASIGNATRDLAGLWWVIVTRLWRSGFDVVVVAPSTRAKYATGDGKEKRKRVVVDGVNAAQGLALRASHHDIADAAAIAALGARRAGAPVEVVPQPWHEQVVADFVRRETERNS